MSGYYYAGKPCTPVPLDGITTTVAAVVADDPEGWREFALCREVDPELFYPEAGGCTNEARGICGSCPVRGFCLEEALGRSEAQDIGIWGGTSLRERRFIRRQRERDAARSESGPVAA